MGNKPIIIHTDCLGPVVLDLNSIINFVGIPVFSHGKLSISTLFLMSKENKNADSFFCTGCNHIISSNEILFLCGNCGKYLPFKSAGKANFHVTGMGSIVCVSCINEYGITNSKPLVKLEISNSKD